MGEFGSLIVRLGSETVQTVHLETPVTTVGRLPDNSVVLPGAQVSGHHAELRSEAHGTVLIDAGSGTGTFLDGVRLAPQQPHILRDGSAVQIGLYLLIYRAGDAQATEPVPAEMPHHSRDWADHRAASAAHASKLAQKPREALPAVLPGMEWRSRYLDYLPVIFQEDDFFRRFLLILESTWEPLEQRQDAIDMYLDARTCPARFLPWLAGWFGVVINPHWPEARVRALLPELISLYRWRGTKYGLTRMIEVCTGMMVEISERADTPFVLQIVVEAPEGHTANWQFIEELVRTHKPAHTGYVIEVRS
jgi:phage tail-like protein